jgi:hypothetical protein
MAAVAHDCNVFQAEVDPLRRHFTSFRRSSWNILNVLPQNGRARPLRFKLAD